MKKTIVSFLFTLAFIQVAHSQPVINDGNNMPVIGYTDSIATITSASTSPGGAGAGMTWDFSALMPVVGGVAKVVNPSTSTYASTFPTANYVIELTPNGAPGSAYEYYVVSGTKWDIVGNGYSIVSGGNYTPNSKLMMPFPFSFNQSVTDTFQKIGSSVGTVTITYDGFGTLVTPYKSYNNVIRVKRDFGGTDYFYDWFNVNPLVLVTSYDNNTQKYTFLSTSVVNGVNELAAATTSSIYPNPVKSNATISFPSLVSGRTATVIFTDVMGRIVKQLAMDKPQVSFGTDDLNSGLYFYTIYGKDAVISKGKFVVR
jgi:hypothetical protein